MAWKVDGNEDFYISTCRELYKQYNGANKCQISATETLKKFLKFDTPFGCYDYALNMEIKRWCTPFYLQCKLFTKVLHAT